MLTLTIRNTNGSLEEVEINKNMSFSPDGGEQFYFNDFADSYSFDLIDGDNSIRMSFRIGSEVIEVDFENLATLIQQNDPSDPFSLTTALGVANDSEGVYEISSSLENDNFSSGEIIDNLKEVLASSNIGTDANGVIIDDFGSLAEALEASAAGEVNSDSSFFINDSRLQGLSPVESTSERERLELDSDSDSDSDSD